MTAEIHRGAPACIHQTIAILEREIQRKEGMIDDLNQRAIDSYGLTPADCSLLVKTVEDRDDMRTAFQALGKLFS